MLDQYILYRDDTEKWRTPVSRPSYCQDLEGGLVEGKVPGTEHLQGTVKIPLSNVLYPQMLR